jgi:hypothetical protein
MGNIDVLEILKLGLPGLVFLMMLMSFRLISKSQKQKLDQKTTRNIRLFIFTNVFLAIVVVAAPIIDNRNLKVETFEIKAIKADSAGELHVGVCTNSPYKNRYMLLRNSDSFVEIVQVKSKGIIPCSSDKEELRIPDAVASKLGWNNRVEGALVVDVAADGFKFDL